MTEPEFRVALFMWEDNCKLIAAGKVQRWDVVKWALAVNLGLASASGFSQKFPENGLPGIFFLLSVAVAVLAAVLVWHYNRRMTGAREMSRTQARFLNAAGIDVNRILGGPSTISVGHDYDREELWIFGVTIGLSILPTLLLALAK